MRYLIFIISPLLIGCAGVTENGKNSSSLLPNPAVKKCIEDGYKTNKIEIFSDKGISITYECINPKNGKKCIAWEYFRGECNLE